MSVYSMTGYANASAEAPAPGSAALHEGGSTTPHDTVASSQASVEIRSVNGRFLDLALRLPDELRSLEPALRELITARFKRGKIELRVAVSTGASASIPDPAPELLGRLAAAEQKVRAHLPSARPLSVQEAMQWCKAAPEIDLSDEQVLHAARRAVEGLVEARAREGARLAAVLSERIDHLRTLAATAEPLVPAAVARLQQRFLERWKEALEQTGSAQTIARAAIEERALNEAAAFAIRIDVAEELARLRSHLDEVARLLAKGGEVGKRLEFLIQELLREANTLGSKSTSIEMTGISVDMKVAIEQLREQVQNVE